jgi:YggT family protein
MLVLANLFEAVAVVLDMGLTIYMWIIIAGAILSWVNPDPYNPIVRFINTATEPVLYQVRKRLPVSFGGIDISPVVVLLAIVFLQTFVVDTLRDLARSMMI